MFGAWVIKMGMGENLERLAAKTKRGGIGSHLHPDLTNKPSRQIVTKHPLSLTRRLLCRISSWLREGRKHGSRSAPGPEEARLLLQPASFRCRRVFSVEISKGGTELPDPGNKATVVVEGPTDGCCSCLLVNDSRRTRFSLSEPRLWASIASENSSSHNVPQPNVPSHFLVEADFDMYTKNNSSGVIRLYKKQ